MKRRTMVSTLVGTLCTLFIAGTLYAGGAKETAKPAPVTVPEKKAVKYVFVFMGDGLAMPQISATEAYANALASKDVNLKRLGFSQFPVTGLCTTYDAGSLITDSASAGTAFASGNKTLNGVINMDVTKTKTYKTIAEYAKEAGKKVGVVSSVSIDHATPASMYAKVPSRGNYYDIAVQLTQSGFDYFGGGGFVQPTGKNKDKPSVYDLAKAQGYTVADSVDAIQSLKPGVGKVIAINPNLRGYAPSQDGRNEFGVGDAVDVLNLVSLIRSQSGISGLLEKADGKRIGVWGHSMGGGVALKVLTIDNRVKAAVLYSSVSADFADIIERWGPGCLGDVFEGELAYGCNSSDVLPLTLPDDLVASYFDVSADPEKLKKFSPLYYFDFVTAPVQIVYGTEDGKTSAGVPPEWSKKMYEGFIKAGVDAKLYAHEGEGHSFLYDEWFAFMWRASQFFDRHVKP